MNNVKKYVLPVNQYGNVSGIPEGWQATKLSVTQLNKLGIPHYKACTGFDQMGKFYKPIIKNIIPIDFLEIQESYLNELTKKKEEKNDKINSIKLTEKVVATALYAINKEAKRQRDIQESIARSIYEEEYCAIVDPHGKLHKAKNRKEYLYCLKEKVIQKVIHDLNLQAEGYHEFIDRDRDMYVWCGFSFHVNEKKSENNLGEIDEYISSDRKRSTPPKKAEQLLLRFLEEGFYQTNE